MERINLPGDLIEEILSRVPAKSLTRFRSTSKQWNALFKSRSFVKMHSANAPKDESLVILLMDSRVYLVRINFHGIHNNVAPSVKIASQFNLNSSQVGIRNVFQCDGLLLCTTKDYRLMVWNPCSRETKWIKPRYSYKKTDRYALGYENKSSFKQYKILGVACQGFTSDSWRALVVTNEWFLAQHDGISMKGNAYWVAIQRDGSYQGIFFLLSFDFSTERFQNLHLPPHLFPSYSFLALSVVREEQLCLLATRSLWVTTHSVRVTVKSSTRSVISWNKFLTLNDNFEHCRYGMSFVADEENKVVVCCTPNSMSNDVLHIVGENNCILNYVPSLAQIQQRSLLGRCKRKAAST